MEHRDLIHDQGQLISAAATVIPALGSNHIPPRFPALLQTQQKAGDLWEWWQHRADREPYIPL